MKKNLSILERQLNELYETHGIVIPKEAFPYIRAAQKSFAIETVQRYKRNNRRKMIATLKPLPRYFRLAYMYFLKMYIRKRFFKLAVKTAKIRAQIEGYKIHVVLATEFTYKTISSRDFKHSKKIKVFKKEVNFMDLERESAFVVSRNNKI